MLSDLGAFELDLADESSRSREERIRNAFEKSKESYSMERIYNEPEWFEPPEIPPPSKLHVRNIDYSLNNMYLKGKYQDTLDLTLSQLEREEENVGKDGREQQLVDMAIRCALKLGNDRQAGDLAERTRGKWSTMPGLAITSVEAFLASSRPRDALTAVLAAISSRGNLPPFIALLYQILENLRAELEEPEAVDLMLSVVRPHVRSFRPLSVSPKSHIARPTTGNPRPSVPEEATAKAWVSNCGIAGVDRERLIELLCHRPRDGGVIDEERSVRTL